MRNEIDHTAKGRRRAIASTGFWPGLWRLGGSCGLACWLVLVGTSCQSPVPANAPPPCPVMSQEAVAEMKAIEGSKLEHWIGRIEQYCCGIDQEHYGGPKCLERGETPQP